MGIDMHLLSLDILLKLRNVEPGLWVERACHAAVGVVVIFDVERLRSHLLVNVHLLFQGVLLLLQRIPLYLLHFAWIVHCL